MTNFNQRYQLERAIDVRKPQKKLRSTPTDSISIFDQFSKMVSFFNDEYAFSTEVGSNLLPILECIGDDLISIGDSEFGHIDEDSALALVDYLTHNQLVVSVPIDDTSYQAISLNLIQESIVDPDDPEITYTAYVIPNANNIVDAFTCFILHDASNDEWFINTNVPLSNLYNSDESYVNTSLLVQSVLSNATSYAEMSYIANQAAQAYNNSNQLNVADFLAYSNLLLKGNNYSQSVGAVTQEIADAISSSQDPLSLLQYLRSVMINAKPVSNSDGFQLTDNSFLVTRSLGSFINEGVETVISTIVTVAGIAIGGFFGAALAIGSTIFSAVKNAYNTITNSKTYVKYSGDFFGLYPYGYNQSTSFYPNNGILYDLSQNTGVAAGDLPFAKLIVKDNQCELRLREFTDDLDIIRNLCEIDNYVISFPQTKTAVIDACLNSINNGNYIPVRYRFVDAEVQDKYQKANLLLSLLVYLIYICSGTYNGHTTTIDLNNETDTWKLDVGLLIQSILNNPSYTIDNLAQWSDLTWNALSGNGGSGTIGVAVNYLSSWALSKDTWYQVNTTFCDGTMTMADMMLESLKIFGNYNYYGLGYNIYFMPASDIIPPSFDSSTWQSSLTIAIAKIILLSTAAFVAIKFAKRAINAFNAKQAAKVEGAHNRLVSSPTYANALAYSKAARRNNFIARFTNGTIFSQSSYWNNDGSTSDSSSSSILLLDKVKDIENLIH